MASEFGISFEDTGGIWVKSHMRMEESDVNVMRYELGISEHQWNNSAAANRMLLQNTYLEMTLNNSLATRVPLQSYLADRTPQVTDLFNRVLTIIKAQAVV